MHKALLLALEDRCCGQARLVGLGYLPQRNLARVFGDAADEQRALLRIPQVAYEHIRRFLSQRSFYVGTEQVQSCFDAVSMLRGRLYGLREGLHELLRPLLHRLEGGFGAGSVGRESRREVRKGGGRPHQQVSKPSLAIGEDVGQLESRFFRVSPVLSQGVERASCTEGLLAERLQSLWRVAEDGPRVKYLRQRVQRTQGLREGVALRTEGGRLLGDASDSVRAEVPVHPHLQKAVRELLRVLPGLRGKLGKALRAVDPQHSEDVSHLQIFSPSLEPVERFSCFVRAHDKSVRHRRSCLLEGRQFRSDLTDADTELR